MRTVFVVLLAAALLSGGSIESAAPSPLPVIRASAAPDLVSLPALFDIKGGEIPPEGYDPLSFEYIKGSTAVLKTRFSPKNLRERSEEDCRRFEVAFFIGDKWQMTWTGKYRYVEDTPGNEVLACVADAIYSQSRGGSNRVEARFVNRNIFIANFRVESNVALRWE